MNGSHIRILVLCSILAVMTVPIGGCDELFGLEGDDVLDKMLA